MSQSVETKSSARVKTPRPKKKALAVPATLEEAQKLERDIAYALACLEDKRTAAEEAIAKINAELEDAISPLRERIGEWAPQVHAFAEEHRRELTNGEQSKTAALGESGIVQWHTSPHAVSITDEKAVLDRFRKLGLTQFIRQPPEQIDKDAILKEQDKASTVAGVSITQAEKVFVRPAGTRAYVESTLGKKGPGKWKIVWPRDEEIAES